MTAKRRPPSPQPRRRPVAGIRRPQPPSPQPRPATQPQPSDAPATSEEDTSTVDTSTSGAVDEASERHESTDESAAKLPVDEESEPASEDEHAPPDDTEGAEKAHDKPKPRQKARAKGITKPAETAEDDAEPKAAKPKKAANRSTLTALTAGIGVLLTVAAVVFAIQYFGVRSQTANKAMSDPIETSQVKGQIQDAVKKVFSYQWNKLDAHEKDVNSVLTGGPVRKQYDALYPDVKTKAPQQKLTVATAVSYSSVLNLTDDSASLLVYIEQSSWRGTDVAKKASGGGFLKVDAKLVDDKWRIAGFDIYKPIKPSTAPGSQTPNGAPAPSSPSKKPSSNSKPAPTTKKPK